MLTSSSYGAIPSVAPSRVYPSKAERKSRAQAVPGNSNYDSLSLSTPQQDSHFHMSLVGRLSREVRTATTTGDIARLRQQVASGEYRPDPMAIAGRILFLGEGR